MTDEERVSLLMQKLRRCHRFLHQRADGGKTGQARLLRELRFHGEMTQRSLQEHMRIQQSSLSELVKKTEEQGLIERNVCPDDKRQLLVRLTEAGREQAERVHEAYLQQNIVFMQVLTEEEQLTLLALLTKLDERWTEEYSR